MDVPNSLICRASLLGSAPFRREGGRRNSLGSTSLISAILRPIPSPPLIQDDIDPATSTSCLAIVHSPNLLTRPPTTPCSSPPHLLYYPHHSGLKQCVASS